MSNLSPTMQQQLVAAHARLKLRISPDNADARPVVTPPSDRRSRSLQTAHRYATPKKQVARGVQKDSGAFVPELAARLENDPAITDGARRCARKIAEEAYRRNRDGRAIPVTVSYLSRALGRCRRTVQRYLRQLEEAGYIAVDVIAGARSRMAIGLVIRLCDRLLASHHRQKWPEKARKPGATLESQKQRFKGYIPGVCRQIPVSEWAIRCMDGVFRSYMKTKPLAALPEIATT